MIFDNDGVLVDSEPLGCRILAEELVRFGYATTPERCFQDFQGGSFSRVVDTVLARTDRRLPESFEERYRRRILEAFPAELRPIEGIREVLEGLTHRRCVASSATLEKVHAALKVTGLARFFGPHTFSARDVGRGKPAPDVFLYAAECMGVAPERCCVVEDSPLGVEAANAAGMTCFAYAGRGDAGRLRPEKGVVFRSMGELPGLLGESASGD